MKRLYYLTDSLDTAENVYSDLKNHGIDQRYLHVLSNDAQGVQSHHLNQAGILNKYDISFQTGIGALWGSAIGFILAATALIPMTAGLLATELIAFTCLLLLAGGTVLGTVYGAILGCHQENRRLKKFHQQILNGMHLLMIDTDQQHRREIENSVHHFETVDAGEEDIWTILPYHVNSNHSDPIAAGYTVH
jgi:hypothetical protein